MAECSKDCPDCGAPRAKINVLGFACQHERCPMFDGETYQNSDAVAKSMSYFWRRLDEQRALSRSAAGSEGEAEGRKR